jgi:hypothetical protein
VSAHVHEDRPGEAAEIREHLAQVMGQALDDLTAPSLLGLAVEDVPAYLPVEPEQFGIDRQRGTLLGGVDATFEVGQPARQGSAAGSSIPRAGRPSASRRAPPGPGLAFPVRWLSSRRADTSVRAANGAPKNATFASCGDLSVDAEAHRQRLQAAHDGRRPPP